MIGGKLKTPRCSFVLKPRLLPSMETRMGTRNGCKLWFGMVRLGGEMCVCACISLDCCSFPTSARREYYANVVDVLVCGCLVLFYYSSTNIHCIFYCSECLLVLLLLRFLFCLFELLAFITRFCFRFFFNCKYIADAFTSLFFGVVIVFFLLLLFY